MLQVCLFGGYEGRLRSDKKLYLTAFGGSDLARPTLAHRIDQARRQRNGGATHVPRCVVITFCGATEICAPTLAEEFMELKSMIDGRALSLAEWDREMIDLQRSEESAISSITLFGGFGEESVPEEDDEVDSLATHRHLGNISEAAAKVLELGIGQNGAQRYAILRKALSV